MQRMKVAATYAGMAIAAAILALVVFAVIFAGSTPSSGTPSFSFQAAPGCPSSGLVSYNETEYSACNATLSWSQVGFNQTRLVSATLDGAQFTVYGYDTMECPVVNVTGVEPSGASFHFLIAPTPMNCEFEHPLVLSPDHFVGAVWDGGSSIQLLVRVG